MSIGDKLGAAIGESLARVEKEERAEAPRRERVERLRQSTPRVIYRDPGTGWYGSGRATYRALRLADVRWMPAHVQTSYAMGSSSKAEKRKIPERVGVMHSGSSLRTVPPGELGEFVRRPKATALRRLEEAEAALIAARRAVADAERAAFTYGKPVTIAAVKDVSRRHKIAWGDPDES